MCRAAALVKSRLISAHNRGSGRKSQIAPRRTLECSKGRRCRRPSSGRSIRGRRQLLLAGRQRQNVGQGLGTFGVERCEAAELFVEHGYAVGPLLRQRLDFPGRGFDPHVLHDLAAVRQDRSDPEIEHLGIRRAPPLKHVERGSLEPAWYGASVGPRDRVVDHMHRFPASDLFHDERENAVVHGRLDADTDTSRIVRRTAGLPEPDREAGEVRDPERVAMFETRPLQDLAFPQLVDPLGLGKDRAFDRDRLVHCCGNVDRCVRRRHRCERRRHHEHRDRRGRRGVSSRRYSRRYRGCAQPPVTLLEPGHTGADPRKRLLRAAPLRKTQCPRYQQVFGARCLLADSCRTLAKGPD